MPKRYTYFLIRFWVGVGFALIMGLSWDPHMPRFVWGVAVGALIFAFVLLMGTWVKRKEEE